MSTIYLRILGQNDGRLCQNDRGKKTEYRSQKSVEANRYSREESWSFPQNIKCSEAPVRSGTETTKLYETEHEKCLFSGNFVVMFSIALVFRVKVK
jgi:hypothetical protein